MVRLGHRASKVLGAKLVRSARWAPRGRRERRERLAIADLLEFRASRVQRETLASKGCLARMAARALVV